MSEPPQEWIADREIRRPNCVHVTPRNDIVWHVTTEDCVCGPEVEHVPNSDGPDGWLYTHHSLDGREANE